MEIDVAAPAVIGREVEDDVYAIDRFAGSVLIEEVAVDELHSGGGEWLDVLKTSTAEVVYDSDRCHTLLELLHQMRSDERRPACDQRIGACEIHAASARVESACLSATA